MSFWVKLSKRCISFILAALMIGCSNSIETPTMPVAPGPQPTVTFTITSSSTATITPAASVTPTITATVRPERTPTRVSPGQTSLRGSWRVFSDPNSIRDIVEVRGQLWAATLGGVVAWDLSTEQARLYTTYDGLAEIQANAVVYCPSDDRDAIYVGHENGWLSRFDLDDRVWSRRILGDTVRSVSERIDVLSCDPLNKRLLVGGPAGVAILDLTSDKWSIIGPAQGLRANTIRSIRVSDRNIWVAAGADGGYVINEGKSFAFNLLDGFPVGEINDLVPGADGGLWLARNAGLIFFRTSDNTLIPYGVQSSTGVPLSRVDRVEIAPDGRIWIANTDQGACPFDPRIRSCTTFYTSLVGYSLTTLKLGNNLAAYVGTDGGGILVLLPDGVRRLVFPNPISGNIITSLAEDAKGMLWAVSNQGIFWHDPGSAEEMWQKFEIGPGGLISAHVRGVRSNRNQLIFFYTDSRWVSFFENGTWSRLSDPLPWQWVWDIQTDKDGHIWIASDQGIFEWNGVEIYPYRPAEVFRAEKAQVLLSIGDTLWVGTDQALWACRGNLCQETQVKTAVYLIASAKENQLLLGTEKGVIKYVDGIQSVLAIPASFESLAWPQVTALMVDPLDRVWVGTNGDGLFVSTSNGWQQFSTLSGLPGDKIYSLVRDRLGTVWIAVGTGGTGGVLVRFIPPEN